MVSTTVEKTLFIVVGLGIFAVAAVPLFDIISGLQDQPMAGDEFDGWVRGTIEYGVYMLENDRSWSWEGELWVPGDVSMSQPDSYTILLVLDDGDVRAEREVRCAFAPFHLVYAGPGPERDVYCEMYYEDGKVFVIFEEMQEFIYALKF